MRFVTIKSAAFCAINLPWNRSSMERFRCKFILNPVLFFEIGPLAMAFWFALGKYVCNNWLLNTRFFITIFLKYIIQKLFAKQLERSLQTYIMWQHGFNLVIFSATNVHNVFQISRLELMIMKCFAFIV